MFKKQLAAVLALVLTLNMMTACTGNGPRTESATGNSEDAALVAGTQEEEITDQTPSAPGAEEDASDGAHAGARPEDQTETDGQQPETGTGSTKQPGTGSGQAAGAGSTQQPGTGSSQAAGAGSSQVAGAGSTQQPGTGSSQESGVGSTKQPGAGSSQSTDASGKPKTAPHTVAGRQESNTSVILPGFTYVREAAQDVGGRQGVACENGEYWVSGSDILAHYGKDWKLIATNAAPFADLSGKPDHLGDIDVYKGEVYACAQAGSGAAASDLQIAVYDGQTLKLTRTYAINAQSGQKDCAGVAVDPDTQSIWTCSWTGDESGSYLYRYSLETGEYIGKIHLQAPPQRKRGIACYKGYLYMAADDGTAELGEPDHIYRWRVDTDSTDACVTLERTLDDAEVVGEASGLSFDKTEKKLLVLENTGALIEQGVQKELYEGYEREIHEVCVYGMTRNAWPLDYGRADLWITKPDAEKAESARADVFAVMPTVNMNMWTPDNEDVTSLRDALRFAKTFNMEKGIFSQDTAIYSPYYRQCTMGVYTLPEAEKEPYSKVAKEDVMAAFSCYLDNCHKEGRPIILFGFSQGGEEVYDILVEFGQDKRLADHLAAAYVIGHGITQADLDASPWLKMAQGETDTGVIVSYECMDQSAAKPDVKILSINPLNWKTDSTPAPAEANRGYVATDTYGNVRQEISAFCGGYLDEKTGILIPTGIESPQNFAAKDAKVVPDGSYHFYDLIFFYNNLKENVGKRIKAFEDAKAAPQPENAGGQATMVPDAKPETNTNEQPGAEKEPGADTAPKADEEITEEDP